MELTNEDKQRIEQEAERVLYRTNLLPRIALFKMAEYATLYERQQQAKQFEDDGEFDKMLQEKYPTLEECERANQYLRDEGEDPEQLGKQGMVFVRTVLKTIQQKEQIQKLEAERSELRNKVTELEIIVGLFRTAYPLQTKRYEEIALLNSLKTKP